MYLLSYLIIIIKILISKSENENNINTYKCQDGNSITNLKIGDKITLCIHIPELKIKMGYLLEIDKYSAISLGGGFSLSYQSINNKNLKIDNISFISQIGNITNEFPAVSLIFYF